MRIFQWKWFLSVMVCLMMGLSVAQAQVSSTEQAVMDKILKLKEEVDQLMMTPGSSSDKAAMDKVMALKRDMDTFLALLPAHLQDQVRKKMAQPAGQVAGVFMDGVSQPEAALPFVMSPQEVQKVEMALMRSQLNSLKRIGAALRQGETLTNNTQKLWVQFVEGVAGSGMEADVPSLTKYAMKEAFAEENAGLESLGSMVRFHREMRKKLKEEIAKVEKLAQSVAGEDGPLTEAIREQLFSLGLDGGVSQKSGLEVKSKKDAVAYLDRLKAQLAKTNEDAEKASLELEDALLKQKPKLKAMSDMAQKLQDSAKAALPSGQ